LRRKTAIASVRSGKHPLGTDSRKQSDPRVPQQVLGTRGSEGLSRVFGEHYFTKYQSSG